MAKHKKHIRRWPRVAVFSTIAAAVIGSLLAPPASALQPNPAPDCSFTECTWTFYQTADHYEWSPPPGTLEVWIEAQSVYQPWAETTHIRAQLNNVSTTLSSSFVMDWAGIAIGSWTFFLASADPTMPVSYEASMVSNLSILPPEPAPLAFVRITQVFDPAVGPNLAPAMPVAMPVATPEPTPMPTTAPPTTDTTPVAAPTSTPEPAPAPVATSAPTATPEAIPTAEPTVAAPAVVMSEPPTESPTPYPKATDQAVVIEEPTSPEPPEVAPEAQTAMITNNEPADASPVTRAAQGASGHSITKAPNQEPPNQKLANAQPDQREQQDAPSVVPAVLQVGASVFAATGGAVGLVQLRKRFRMRRTLRAA